MPVASEPARGTPPSYFVRFGLTAATLATVTLALVLVVLPRRYVLGSGFRESGISFPAEGAPFVPGDAVRRPAAAFPMLRPEEVVPAVASGSGAGVVPGPGPAELLWSMAAPLMAAERYDEAAALFEEYLARYPDDRGALREYAVVLFWADRRDETVDVYAGLLGGADDTEVRLLLARTLRDLDRPGEADPYYRTLWARSEDPARALEWSRSWSWAEEYAPAMAILEKALDRFPGDTGLRVELARLFYYSGRPEEARSVLAGMDEVELREAGGVQLRADVAAALAVPAPVEEEATLLERAVRARTQGSLDEAERLFRSALAAAPEDAAVWEAWADFLQYEREDYPGARDALLRVEALEGATAARELRLARLELWSGDAGAAELRLTRLLADLSDGSIEPGPEPAATTRAEALTLVGDLRRWDGDRVAADLRYRAALAEDPTLPGATEGLEALRTDVARVIDREERPGVAVVVSGLADTDDYGRLDVAGEGSLVRGPWVLRVEGGHRWLEGVDLAGGTATLRGGYGGVEAARWWRQGTLRTSLRGGLDDVGTTESTLGAEVRLLLPGGGRIETSWERGPAYMILGTLQSRLAAYTQDQVRVRASRRLGSLWTVAGDMQVARLSSELVGVEDPTRVSVAGSVSREVGLGLTWGGELRTLLFTEAAPEMGGRPLFWDPEGVVSAGPYLALDRSLSPRWRIRGRLAAGAALLDEARIDEPGWAPQLAAEGGVGYDGSWLRATGDLFYLQGQFRGYRSWGLRLRLSSVGWGGGR